MSSSSYRLLPLLPIALALASPAISAQTIETIAGAVDYAGASALQMPLQPRGVAVSPDGHVYVSDSIGNRVLKYDASAGTLVVIAGRGRWGYNGDGGPAIDADLASPRALTFDAAGNLYIADSGNYRVRRVDAVTGVITTIAGNGSFGGAGNAGDGGAALAASFVEISGLALDAAGDLFIADEGAHRIRVVAGTTGVITTYAGNGVDGTGGDGVPASTTNFSWPQGLAIDASGNLYVADMGSHRVRRIAADTGIVTTVAGVGGPGSGADGIPATQSPLRFPTGIAFDAAGNLYISNQDQSVGTVRVVAADTGLISTAIGGGANGGDGPALNIRLNVPETIAVAANGVVYVGEREGNRLRAYTPDTRVLTTLAGNDTASFCGEGQPAIGACLAGPRALAFDTSGNLFVSDFGNGLVRKIDAQTGLITRVAGASSLPEGFTPDGPLVPYFPRGLAVDSAGNVFIAEGQYNRVHKVDAQLHATTSVAGSPQGYASYCGDGGSAASACLNAPQAVAVDAFDNLYIADSGNHRVRKIDSSTGIISTVAGTGNDANGAGPGAPALLVALDHPSAVAVDYAGNLFIADHNSSRITRVDAQTGILSLVALQSGVVGLTLDGLGNLYVTDALHHRIRRIDASSGAIATVAGTGVAGFAGDGGPASVALLDQPMGVAVDANGNLYLSDSHNNRIRRVSAPPVIPGPQISITTPAEGATLGFYADVTAQYACTDSDSNVLSCTGSVANGTRIPTTVPGSRLFSVSTTNAAGGRSVQAHKYRVEASFHFEGFLTPIANPPAINVVPRSRTIPIQWRLPDPWTGGFISNTASLQSLTTTNITCPSAPRVTVTAVTTGSGLRYDAPTGTFTYAWSTGGATSCRKVTVTLRDGSTHDLLFKVE